MLDRDLSLPELEAAAGYLNENFHGWSIDRIRAEMAAVSRPNAANTTGSCVPSKSFAARERSR